MEAKKKESEKRTGKQKKKEWAAKDKEQSRLAYKTLVLLGEGGVGKSAIRRRLVEDIYTEQYEPTIPEATTRSEARRRSSEKRKEEQQRGMKELHEEACARHGLLMPRYNMKLNLHMVDLSGQIEYERSNAAMMARFRPGCVLLVVDPSSAVSVAGLEKQHAWLEANAQRRDDQVRVLVWSKMDVARATKKSGTRREKLAQLERENAVRLFSELHPKYRVIKTSAKTRKGIDALMDVILTKTPLQHDIAGSRLGGGCAIL